MKRHYVPTEYDIKWTFDQLRRLNDGGVLAFPAAKLEYLIDHKHRRLLLRNPDQLKPRGNEHSRMIHEATIETCKVLGYKVVVEAGETIHEVSTGDRVRLLGRNPRGGY